MEREERTQSQKRSDFRLQPPRGALYVQVTVTGDLYKAPSKQQRKNSRPLGHLREEEEKLILEHCFVRRFFRHCYRVSTTHHLLLSKTRRCLSIITPFLRVAYVLVNASNNFQPFTVFQFSDPNRFRDISVLTKNIHQYLNI